MNPVIEPPINAGALQRWVNQSFNAFTGPPKAYFEIPVKIEGTSIVIRRTYVVVGMKADDEAYAVIAMQKRFEMCASDFERDDRSVALFWRRAFEWDPEARILHARIAFMDEERMKVFPLRIEGTNEIMDPLSQ